MEQEKVRVSMTTTFLPERYPELDAFVREYRETGRLSARMRELILLGLKSEHDKDPNQLAAAVASMIKEMSMIRGEMALIRGDVVELSSKVVAVQTPVPYDATQHNEEPGIDISQVDSSVVDNLMKLGE